MPTARTVLIFSLLLSIVLSTTACGGKAAPSPSPAAKGAKAVDPNNPWGSKGPWFEQILERSKKTKIYKHPIPHTSVFIKEVPGEKATFLLGRNGGIHRLPVRLSDLPFRSKKEARRGCARPDIAIERVILKGTFASGDMGSIGFALDPNYATNRFIYVWWVDKKDENLFLDRMTWTGDEKKTLASKVNIINFSRRNPPKPYHMGGILEFMKDGTLLITPGDAERPELAQDPTDLNGKFLRIQPRLGKEGGYDVPKDNPFVGREGYRPEIFAMGLRAPFRAYFHNQEELIFGDVGSIYEEINVWKKGRLNFGWGRTEKVKGGITDGSKYKVEGDTLPIVEWDKKIADEYCLEDPDYSGEDRLSAGVGVIYNPPAGKDRYDGRLTNKLIFFDIMRGFIRAGVWKGADAPFEHEHIGHRQFISHMAMGDDGYLYVTTYGGGTRLWRMRSPLDTEGTKPTK